MSVLITDCSRDGCENEALIRSLLDQRNRAVRALAVVHDMWAGEDTSENAESEVDDVLGTRWAKGVLDASTS